MTRQQYRQARRLIRDNGKSAIRWLPADVAEKMDVLVFGQMDDYLATRADILAMCKRHGLTCNARQSGRMH